VLGQNPCPFLTHEECDDLELRANGRAQRWAPHSDVDLPGDLGENRDDVLLGVMGGAASLGAALSARAA